MALERTWCCRSKVAARRPVGSEVGAHRPRETKQMLSHCCTISSHKHDVFVTWTHTIIVRVRRVS